MHAVSSDIQCPRRARLHVELRLRQRLVCRLEGHLHPVLSMSEYWFPNEKKVRGVVLRVSLVFTVLHRVVSIEQEKSIPHVITMDDTVRALCGVLPPHTPPPPSLSLSLSLSLSPIALTF